MLRSTSHIGGIGVTDRGSVEMPSSPQSAVVEEKKLHLMIDNRYEIPVEHAQSHVVPCRMVQ
ncbi:hypothetical protein NECAME_15078 [Necator americanus]|uniref:Uncharacterized protein n=1 Tax=Necator americanus TaxID=51031 RepID=W2SJV5_NECAM|nr:hypothetical protein NECAME_15078 [Necator americanus]ETN69818.1 hypothetical protein NECAME_15078 [Necator americanus]